MPVTWTISTADRLVSARAEGIVTLTDIEALLDDIVVKDALTYRKMFDGRGAIGQYDDADVMSLGARIQAYNTLDLSGAAAIVVDTQERYDVALRFANIAKAKRPIRVFWDPQSARTWLDSNPTLEDSV
ncbi:MAG: hypothetical protein JSR24_04185 [Proteobacteria bacterium]|nr:hypothetical protein [Pseudomonadota bacterium]